jgi:hypothetical protein
LAPAFAAGFAAQKLLEIFDAAFSFMAAKTAEILEKSSSKIKDAKKPNVEAKTALTKAKNTPTNANDKTKVEAEKNLKDMEEKVKETEENLDKAKKEFEKSLKVLFTGIAAIALGWWIVSEVHISVLTPIFNLNATTGAISANNAISINQNIDKVVTVLFIAAGTEGINSILKYLGYAKEKKED